MKRAQFETGFESRLRALLHRATLITEPATVAMLTLSSVANFLLQLGAPSTEIAALLRKAADELDEHQAELQPKIN